MAPSFLAVGDLQILAVWDGRLTLVQPSGFPPWDSPEFEPHSRYITPAGEYVADLGAFLIRVADQVVLVDAGLGPGASEGLGTYHPSADAADMAAYLKMFRAAGVPEADLVQRERDLQRQKVEHGGLPASLAGLGVQPGEVTDVVISHMHPDHMGWVSYKGLPFFPNAKIWVHSADADWMLGDNPPDEDGMRVLLGTAPTPQRLEPVLDRIHLWTEDIHVAPGILLRHLPGHTPGNAIAVVSSGSDTAYILGDTLHCPLELTDESFHVHGDVDFEQAKLQKSVIRREIEAGAIPVASPHFPDLAFGRIVLDQGRRSFSWVN